ncbi:uncharacterized protein LOC133814167 [Humulus lupulus]|uniref:uncharacterized protein LOC133814167 n=1 Tax=Humulus lupulus TaxID=3486 RepID=UPI002B400D85|nr:uncharacterized protein LOC133814167 [Humulus lupulus]
MGTETPLKSSTQEVGSSMSEASMNDTYFSNQEKVIPNELISQFQALTISNDKNMPVLVTGAMSPEEEVQELCKQLAKRDEEVVRLSTQLAQQANVNASKQKEVEVGQNSSPSIPPLASMQHPPVSVQSPPAGSQPSSDLKTLIMESIREYQAETSMPIIGYNKPYPAYYDQIPFLANYIRQKFEKFDGIEGSPHEHLAYFTSTCGEFAQSDALLISQFVQSLKGATFTWYTKLPPGSINTWDDMQKAFLAQFVSLRKVINIHDLVETKQRPNENANC